MKILIVDDSPEFRTLVRHYLTKELSPVEIIDYEVENVGRPPDNFNWSDYNVLLLDYKLGESENGLEWLQSFRNSPGFPPTVMLTAEGDEYTAVKAIKLGAADYINKKDISPKRLAGIVIEAAEYGPQKVIEQEAGINKATRIIQYIHRKREPKSNEKLDVGYKFVRLIGEGAMSKVYLAERIADGLTLVLKVLDLTKFPQHATLVRFTREAELIANINSPFVVKIFEHGLTEDYGFIAMEFFSRGDLKQRMELNITREMALSYMTHISYGLDAIHKAGVIHRDLKPANIMFRGDDSLALADFGISKKMDDTRELTTIGQVLGTPHYMSPEQGEGKQVDERSDLYSAGVLLYELLANKKPFVAKTPAALIYQHVHGDIPKLPQNLLHYQHIINKALAKDPDDRYQSAMEFIKVLETME